jgi:hypothetical protein
MSRKRGSPDQFAHSEYFIPPALRITGIYSLWESKRKPSPLRRLQDELAYYSVIDYINLSP